MIQTSYEPAYEDQPAAADEYDVIVIGGGPAGATTAALVAEQGYSVLLLERESVPRFHVGESLIPECYRALDRLGLVERLEASSFTPKYSVQFVSDGHKYSAPFYFTEHPPYVEEGGAPKTWQVERGEFDKLLLDRAIELEATVRTDAQVMGVLFEDAAGQPVAPSVDATAVGVKVRFKADDDSVPREIRCRVVADASGQSAYLSSRLKIREGDDRLKKATVWTYWHNARRDEGRDEYATIIMQTEGKRSWFWYIPLQDNVVSVGCTGDIDDFFADGASPEQAYQRELSRCPALQERLAEATNLHGYHSTKDFSYYSSQPAGDGWVLVGDAFGFIDPCYSTGVFLALHGGMVVADAIGEALRTDRTSGETLGRWAPAYKAGVENFRRLVYAFYTPGFSFADFFRQHPQYRTNMTDILVGNVFKPGVDEIFDAMGEVRPPNAEEKRAMAETVGAPKASALR